MKKYLGIVIIFGMSLCLFLQEATAGDDKVVVIRLDHRNIIAGFAGENRPRVRMPAVIGYPRGGGMVGMGRNARPVIGHGALKRKSTLRLSYPVKNRAVVNIKDFRLIVHHILYNRLRVSPEDVQVFILDGGARTSREKMTRMFFETFKVKGFYLMSRKLSWRTGARVASRSVFQELFLTRVEYQNLGDIKRIHKKFR